LGPKYLHQKLGQVVAPRATPAETSGNFSVSTIAMRQRPSNDTISRQTFADPQAFQVHEGQLTLTMAGETNNLITGDLAFIPGNTTFSYWSDVRFTKINVIKCLLHCYSISEPKFMGIPNLPTKYGRFQGPISRPIYFQEADISPGDRSLHEIVEYWGREYLLCLFLQVGQAQAPLTRHPTSSYHWPYSKIPISHLPTMLLLPSSHLDSHTKQR